MFWMYLHTICKVICTKICTKAGYLSRISGNLAVSA